MKRILLLILVLAGAASAQSLRYDGIAIGPRGPVPGATVAVCTQPATITSTPCSPLATLATATNNTSGGANPLTADALGNFHFYAAPNTLYTIQIFSPQISPPTVLADQTLSGGIAANQATFNTTEYVGAGITAWSGSDIGAQINSAYAALPATGGTIVVLPQTGGGCYAYTTPITFTTASKPVLLEGSAATNQTPSGGPCLNYTPTTATSAITLDYLSSGGGGYAPSHGIRDLTLVNNGCATNGGCGSSATGIAIGNTNGGAGAAEFFNLKVQGFGTGYLKSNGTSWGQRFDNCSFVWNTTGLSLTNAESDSFTNCRVAVNGTGITISNSELNYTGGSIDSNTTVGVTCTNGVSTEWVAFLGVHFENLNVSNTAYLTGTCNWQVVGGIMLDDTATGTTPFYISAQGSNFTIYGTEFQSSGQTVTTVVSLAGGSGVVRGYMAGVNISPTTGITTMIDTASAGRLSQIADFNIIGGSFNTQTSFKLNAPLGFWEQSAPSGLTSADVCYGDSSIHTLKCNFNNTASYHPVRTIEYATCTMAAGTCTANWSAAYNSTPACFVQWNGTGAVTGFIKGVPSTGNCVVTSSVNTDTGVMQVIGVGNPN